ncbi:PIG-L family deacetylase [Pseudarthrobacter sp. Fe7]|nr:PIG-L family deacetylase [Pseudarthrobacter sp. Fe7]
MTASHEQAQGPFNPDIHRVGRVLCFAAHPDDIDFGAAGTVAAWTAAGVQVSYCIMTDGDAGALTPPTGRTSLPCATPSNGVPRSLVGVTDIHYLHQRDGYLEASHEVMKGVVRLIREIRPDVVLAMHPERNWQRIQKSHPDHLAVGEAVTRAVYPALENPFAYPELAEAGLEAYKLPWLWLYAGPEERENHFVDVTAQVDAKLAAIHVHVSQHPDVAAMEATVRQGMHLNATRAGLSGERSAEAFHVVAINGPGTIAGF